MSVIIRLQNLPWSANALDIRNFFRGLSIPEGGVHIVGGELGDAFIAFSTDEDARQAMMLDGGKIKEIQVKLLLSSRSEMHKVIETARQSVPILTLTAPAPAPPAPVAQPSPAPALAPFATALAGNNSLSGLGIPGLGNPLEIPQPAVIEPPTRISISPPLIITPADKEPEKDEDDRTERKRSKEKERRRSKSRSRSRDRKDRKRDRRDRDRSRSRDRRRRDRSRSRDRKRDRRNRSRSRDRSPSRHSRDRRTENRKSPNNQEFVPPQRPPLLGDPPAAPPPPAINNPMRPNFPGVPQLSAQTGNGPNRPAGEDPDRIDPDIANRLQELSKKRNPSMFQGDHSGGLGAPSRFHNGGPRGGNSMRGGRRDAPRSTRFESDRECCVAIRNAPNHTSYGDVRRFFPFMIDKHGIKMINDQTGRRTGNIYVRFCEPRSKQLSLQRRNNELKGQEVIVEHLDDEAYEAAVDSFLPFREDNVEHAMVVPEPEPVQQAYTVLRISDLPNFVKEHDIIKSFNEFSLLSIALNDCRNTRTKTAFVQFVKPEDARLAFDRRERLMFGRRTPTVVPVSTEEYEQEKMMQQNMAQMPEVPRLSPPAVESPREEPSPAAPRDPRQRRAEPQQQQAQPQAFFPNAFIQQQGFPAAFPSAQFGGFPPAGGMVDPRGSPLDPRAGQIQAPMDPRGAAWGGPRPTFPNPMQLNGENVRPNIEDEPLDCVLMKGLPRDATDRTIVEFLADTGAVPARIHLMLDQSGMPSGDCFCEFRSPGEARRAATKHAQNLDGCRVTVDLVMRSVVEDALEGPKVMDRVEHEGLLVDPQMQQPFFEHPRGGFGNTRGLFRGRGGFERGGFERGGFNAGFERGRGGFERGRGRGGFDRGRGIYERGGRGGFERGRGRGFVRGRGGFDNGFEDRREQRVDEPDPGLEDFGAPGCVVTLENVPFRATVDDILQFFSEFELTQDDVIRRFNERGQPTGDARVAFRTPFDAQRACKTHHLEMILDRRITLNIL